MNLLQILHNPTSNNALSIIPKTTFMSVFWILITAVTTQMHIYYDSYFIAFSVFNFGFSLILGLSIREQMSYAFTATLPNYRQAITRHILVSGIRGNVLLAIYSLIMFDGSVTAGLTEITAFCCLGIALYFILVSTLLTIRNLPVYNILHVLTGFWLPAWLLSNHPRILNDFINSCIDQQYLLLLLAALGMTLFYQRMRNQNLSRDILNLPVNGGFDGPLNSHSYQEQQRETERLRDSKNQLRAFYRWLSHIQLPGFSLLSDHINIVLNRTIAIVINIPVLILLIALHFLHRSGQYSFGGFILISSLMSPVLFFYLLHCGSKTEVSPLLPYSRIQLAIGQLISNFTVLAIILGTLSLSYLTIHLTIETPLALHRMSTEALILCILLNVPLMFLAQLWLNLLHSFWNAAQTIAVIALMLLSFNNGYHLLQSYEGKQSIEVIYWIMAAFWGLYLVLLFLRYRKGSLVNN